MGSKGTGGASAVACGGSTLLGEPLDDDRRRSLFILQPWSWARKRHALHFPCPYDRHPQCMIAPACETARCIEELNDG
jgi:hypothetical protein